MVYYDKYYLLVYEIDGQIIGEVMLLIRLNLSHGGKSVGYIENLVVDKAYRGKGVGRKLMETASEKAKLSQCYKLILDCSDHNVPIYEKLGFSLTDEKNMRIDI